MYSVFGANFSVCRIANLIRSIAKRTWYASSYSEDVGRDWAAASIISTTSCIISEDMNPPGLSYLPELLVMRLLVGGRPVARKRERCRVQAQSPAGKSVAAEYLNRR